MGVMNNLRENTGVILWILVFSFGVIWVLQDSQMFDAIGAQPRDIAVVNGTPIQYQEYQQTLQQQMRRYREQLGEVSQAQEEQIQEQTYTQLVNSVLIEQEMERMGVTVTDAEVLDMVYGDDPHPLIRQQFADSTGQINYALLQNFAQNTEAKETWRQIEDYLIQQRRQQKMSNIVQATVHISEKDVERFHKRQNASVAVEYVALRYASVPNDSITISDADLRDYYDENKEDFKRERTVRIQYIEQPKVATSQDTTLIAEDLEAEKENFAQAENDSLFLAQNASDREYSAEYRTPDQMEAEIASAIYQNLEPGTVVGPVFANEAGHLIKIVDTQPIDETFVRASHILINTNDGEEAARERAQALRDTLQQGGVVFADLARTASDGPSASRGGDLGWFGPGRMAEPFYDAATDAPVNEVVGPVKTQFGYHLIEVTARADESVRYADLAFSLRPSPSTLTDFQNRLADVAYYAEDSGDFAAEAKNQGYEVRTTEVEEGTPAIPGIGPSRQLTSFIETADEGAISDVVELDDKFVVARVESVTPEGYRPFDEVETEIRPRVQVQKKKDVVVRRMNQALRENSFEGLPATLGTRMRSNPEITMTTTNVAGLGQDPTFAGVAFGLDEGETSQVMEGANAAYVVRVTSRTNAGDLSETERNQIRQRLIAQQQRQVASQWLAALREKADITDNRSAFNQ